MFNKKNKLHRFFLGFFISLFLSSVFLFSSSVLAGDVLGTDFLEGEIALSSKDPRAMVSQIINVALGLLSIIAVIIVIYGGFVWMTSEGDDEKVNKAKRILKAGVIGLVIVLASWGITAFVLNKLGGATGTAGVACEEGLVRPCGCDGESTCVDGRWGSCVGSSCLPGGQGSSCYDPDGDPFACSSVTTCNSGFVCDDCECKYPGEGEACGEKIEGVCTPDDNNCSNPNLFCDEDSCTCEASGNNNYSELGDPCFDGGSCSADSPACNPNHGLTCSPDSCTCVGNPVITGFSPLGGFCNNNRNKACSKDLDCGGGTCNFTMPNTSGGNFFTILGYNFGEYDPTNSKVNFISENDSSIFETGLNPSSINSYCSDSWTNTSITVALPTVTSFILIGPNAHDLDVEVITKENKSYKISENPQLGLVRWNLISRPGICAMSDESANLNDEVWYYGTNLKDGQAYFGNNVNNVLAYAPQIFNDEASGVASVPNLSDGQTSTFVQKTVSGVPIFSNFLGFTKLAEGPQGPSISLFSPSSGSSGQYVTIFGSGFNSVRGNSSVTFRKAMDSAYSREANYNFPPVCAHSVWSDDQIIVKVPDNIDNDSYELVLKIGSWPEIIANNFFEVDSSLSLSPGLCKISPKSGPQKSPVSLWGEYFGASPSVVFNINKGSSGISTSTEDTADKISTTVPDEAITGPVVVKRDSLSSNGLDFFVASCSSDDDCDSGACCYPGTPLAGACVSNPVDCFSGTPVNSSFEWGFTTGFSTSTPPTGDNIYSCSSYDFCPTEKWTCPNTPGFCSSYNASGALIETGNCDYNCSNFTFCGAGGVDCNYQASIDRCVDENIPQCDLSKNVTYDLGFGDVSKIAVCKSFNPTSGPRNYFEITVDTVCPNDWTLVPGSNDKCVDVDNFGDTSTCDVCSSGFSCYKENALSEKGFCSSPKVCSGDSICYNDNQCKKPDTSSCQCCCEKSENLDPGPGNPACCYPLTCSNSCGVSAVAGAENTNFGLCSGCALAGSTTADRDLACNCTNVSGQYCDDSQYSEGVCLDCTSLGESACRDHSSSCCWDEKNTTCRGGVGDETVWGAGNTNKGYCPYYSCDANNTTLCNNLPVVEGDYNSFDACDKGCFLNCSQINDEGVCKAETACCWNASTNKCLGGGVKYSNNLGDSNYGLCAYFNCATAGSTCVQGTTTTKYLDQNTCYDDCLNTPSGFGGPCNIYNSPDYFCEFGLCNKLSCLQSSGDDGDDSSPPSSCGVCCCDPNLDPSDDKCSDINEKLTCVADKGLCDGPSRGLCCGCSSDTECSPDGVPPIDVGCGFDSCCKVRPKIETDTTKTANLKVFPEHTSDDICRNALIEISFDQKMNPLSIDNNILLLEESQDGTCSSGTYQISFSDEVYKKQKGFLAGIKKVFQKTINLVASLTGKTAVASPSSASTYCAVLGLSDFVHDASKTKVYFKPNSLLKPNTKYFAVVKGDEDLDSSSGILSFDGVGMNGPGYYSVVSPAEWKESGDATGINFGTNEVYYTNSYIWEFTTLSVSATGQGICEVDYVKVSPESYLFQTTVNDINENDTDPSHSTFNSARDRDVQYTARAYSVDGQLIAPTSGYSWTYEWEIANDNIFSLMSGVSGWNNNGDKRLVRVNSGITDGKSNISATVKMDTSNNIISAGNNTVGKALAYVLICRNPWPGFNEQTGLWHPWRDTGGSFAQFNYELYYCRDHGSDSESDDLPAFLNDLAITKGNSLIRVCSNLPSKTCSDSNDCPAGGLCLASFLKETYFFRDAIERFVKNVSVVDATTSGQLNLSWQSEKDMVTSYKIYFKPSSSSNWSNQTVPLSNCDAPSSTNICSYSLSGLTDGQEYNLYIVAMYNSVETNPSLTYTATPTMYIPVFNICGDLLHYNGYNYKTVFVGGKCWFAENLRTIKLNNGTDIDKIESNADWSTIGHPAYSWYKNNYDNLGSVYGGLYNFFAAEDPHICPVNWRVPNRAEITNLLSSLGVSSGGKMKDTAICGNHPCWNAPNTGATNSSKLTILAGGWRNSVGTFGNLGSYYSAWSREENSANTTVAFYLRAYNNSDTAAIITQSKNFGMSIRCMKD